MILKNIKEFVENWKSDITERIKEKNLNISLAIVQVGNNQASNRYVRNKIKDCKEVGINTHNYWYEEDITEDELLLEIKDLQEHYSGIIV